MPPEIFTVSDVARKRMGFLSLDAMANLMREGSTILDPFSTLISKRARIGPGNLFYPGVTLQCLERAKLIIGSGNVFHAGTFISSETGSILIGDENQFGEGGFTARANRPGAQIAIGDLGRYLGGAAIYGKSELGSGCQVLGAIVVESCHLAAGRSFADPDPDLRGGLLKGFGSARKLTVGTGQVIAGNGNFSPGDLKAQSSFHAEKPHAKSE